MSNQSRHRAHSDTSLVRPIRQQTFTQKLNSKFGVDSKDKPLLHKSRISFLKLKNTKRKMSKNSTKFVLCIAVLLTTALVIVLQFLFGFENISSNSYEIPDLSSPSLKTEQLNIRPQITIAQPADSSTAFIAPEISQTTEKPPRPIPPQLLQEWPNLFTYHPKIDCKKGRYLAVDQKGAYIDGTGMTLITHSGVTDWLINLGNLTLINWPLKTLQHQHAEETDADRRRFFEFYHWNVKSEDAEACGLDAPINKNILVIESRIESSCSSCAKPEWFTQAPLIKKQVDEFLSTLPKDEGYTIKLAKLWQWRGDVCASSLVWETRWHSLNKQVRKTVYPDDFSPERKRDIHVALHIRAGDLLNPDRARDAAMRLYHPWALEGLLRQFVGATPKEIRERMLLTIYSEGEERNYLNYLSLLESLSIRHRLHLNGPGTTTLGLMIESDVVLLAKSSLSRAVCFFNSESLKIGADWDSGVFQCCRNIIAVNSNMYTPLRNQTLTIVNTEDLMKRLVRLVKRKDALIDRQEQTLIDPTIDVNTDRILNNWLDNFSVEYPRSWMFLPSPGRGPEPSIMYTNYPMKQLV